VLADAAQAAIRCASANRLRVASGDGSTGGGKGGEGSRESRRRLDQRRADDAELEVLTGLTDREPELQLAHGERLIPR
jgi:hypothetical protein